MERIQVLVTITDCDTNKVIGTRILANGIARVKTFLKASQELRILSYQEITNAKAEQREAKAAEQQMEKEAFRKTLERLSTPERPR